MNQENANQDRLTERDREYISVAKKGGHLFINKLLLALFVAYGFIVAWQYVSLFWL